MTEWALHSTPPLRGVLREQVRAVGLALRGPAAALGALAALATALVLSDIVRNSQAVDFHPERWVLAGVAGLLLPAAVWKGEERFGAAFLWTLPVDRRGHTLARAFAGWAWLMAGVAAFVLWLLALALVSGGSVGVKETLLTIPSFPLPGPGPIDAATVRPVQWTPARVLWLVPFTAATATYLLSTAVTLGVRHPLRWIAAIVLAGFLVATVSEAADAEGAAELPEKVLSLLVAGRYGLETVLIASTESLKIDTTLSTGERAMVWRGLPDPGQWAMATLIWTAAGLAALWAAASRHGERRRR
ncbi:MAG TPA: hypothetical protein VEQ60_10485 [Longimicrobium sp.]|nr:hypothetical protein [Longimicrobium sp.]